MSSTLSSYSRDTLEHVLHIVKLYRTSMKQIGKRAHLEDPKDLPALVARIEYAPGVDQDTLGKYSKACLSYSFPEYKNDAKPLFVENPTLGGGVRVFVGDDMVDITLTHFESLLKH